MIKISHLWCLAILTVFVSSCGVAKKVNYKQVYAEIQSAQQSNNVLKLMSIYAEYPEYEEYLSSYLTSKQNYDAFSYGDLKHFTEAAEKQGIPQLYEDMKYIRSLREQRIEENISRLDIPSMGEYYFAHTDEMVYLDSLLLATVGPVLDDADYVTLRQVHQAFDSSPLGTYADQYYFPLRAELLGVLENNMAEYFKSEIETLEAVKNQAIIEFDEYTQGVVENIVSYLLDNKLSWLKRNVNDQADKITGQFYDVSVALDIVHSNMENYLTEASSSRDEFCDTAFQGLHLKDVPSLSMHARDVTLDLNPHVPYGAYMNLRNAQRKIDWFGVGLTAASFVVAWPAGIILDAADLAYGIRSDKAKESAVAEEFNKFIPAAYSSLTDTNIKHIELYFTNMEIKIQQSQRVLDKYVKENF